MESKGLGDQFAEVSSMSKTGKVRCTTMDLGILKGLWNARECKAM